MRILTPQIGVVVEKRVVEGQVVKNNTAANPMMATATATQCMDTRGVRMICPIALVLCASSTASRNSLLSGLEDELEVKIWWM